MITNKTNTTLEAKRQLTFLSTFDKKFEGFRKEMERLRRASSTGKAFGGRWPTDGLERTARSLIGAGAVYGLSDISDWAKEFLKRIDIIRVSKEPPTDDDLIWLGEKIGNLEQLQKEVLETSTQTSPNTELKKNKTTHSTTELNPKSNTYIKNSTPNTNPSLNSLIFVCIENKDLKKQISSELKRCNFKFRDQIAPTELLDLATQQNPEVIIIDIDEEEPWGSNISDILSLDPLTDLIPVLKITSKFANAKSNILLKPVKNKKLITKIKSLLGSDLHAARITMGLKDPTISELVDFVNSEIQYGVLDSATGPHANDKFRIKNEGQVMASIWALISQIRKTANRGSNGKINFIPATSGQMGMMALSEAEEVLNTSTCIEPDESGLASLKGLRALIVDDDPEVRFAFNNILSEAGVNVSTATNGIDALTIIKETFPDFILSDIVMPGIDGWELCNRIRQDYSLRNIPIILLSWKEDFLERMRGLNVDANEFMLKDVDRLQILARAIRAIRPRMVLQRQLGIDGDVSGRIERVGVLTILKAVSNLRPNCRINLKESWNYFEVDYRDAELVAIKRTGTDGSFNSGLPALELLLGINSGRFTISDTKDTPKRQFKEGTKKAIDSACEKLNKQVYQVIDNAMLSITSIQLNNEVLELYKQIMPAKWRLPLDKLQNGETPKDIISSQNSAFDSLEILLLDLIRTGGIVSISDSGHDQNATQNPIPLFKKNNSYQHPIKSSQSLIDQPFSDTSSTTKTFASTLPARLGLVDTKKPSKNKWIILTLILLTFFCCYYLLFPAKKLLAQQPQKTNSILVENK